MCRPRRNRDKAPNSNKSELNVVRGNPELLLEVHQEETGGDLVMGEHSGAVMGGPPKATHRNRVNALMLDGNVTSRRPGTDKWWGIGK